MIEKLLKQTTLEEVISFEEKQIEAISKIVDSYKEKFMRLTCNLELEFGRLNKKYKVIEGEISKNDLINGYSSGIAIYIKKDGSFLSFNLPDDEGILQVYEYIVTISRRLTKIYIDMCDDNSDIEKELDEYLDDIKRLGVKPVELYE